MRDNGLIVISLILLLTVGFASVNTYLDLNGKVDMSLLESDLDVVFKEVLLNKEKSENTIIIENGKSFIYSADDLTSENNTSNIDYVVMNRSHQYDVEVTVSCTSDYETYLKYNGTFDNNKLPLEKGILIEAGEVKIGNIIAELKSENTSEESLVLKCTLNYIPVSRETIVEDNEYLVTLDSGYEEKLSDIKVKYYEEYNKLPELTRSNYKFLGWYTEEDIKVDNNSLVKIKGNHTLHAKWEKICEYDPGKEWTFDYTGSEQEFSVPCDGNYKLETWGAQGGTYNTTYYGGYGAYSIGNINLDEQSRLYINVGGIGNMRRNNHDGITLSGGYNGGGDALNSWTASTDSSNQIFNISGGGATHISFKSGLLQSLNNDVDQILIVSSGGGGAQYFYHSGHYSYFAGGHAGGIDGGISKCTYNFLLSDLTVYNTATQTVGAKTSYNVGYSYGSFGKGASGYSGGGGGYYGGAGNYCVSGGGSSYIGNPLLTNKAMYCYNCAQSSDVATKTVSNTCTSTTPTANCAKQGNGYAKITYLG